MVHLLLANDEGPMTNDAFLRMKRSADRKEDGSFQQVHEDRPEDRQPLGTEQLIEQIKETADKLIRDGTNRGDVKLLNTALKELRYALKVFAPFKERRKVTVFGSARVLPDNPAYQQAVLFGRRIAEAGFMVITGAASGIMEAGMVGAGRANSIGVNILLPFEQEANPIIAGDIKLMHLKYFFTRKLMFVKESDAVAHFAGGFGTQDECFEVLTLVQTGKSHIFPIVMVDEPGGDYWKRWDHYIREVLLGRKMIAPSDLALYRVTDSAEAAAAEVVRFYRVYHSMRYVGPNLVLRLQQRLADPLLARLRKEFADIVVGTGTIEQKAALPAEANDVKVASLPRLVFHFDRRSLGRLRMMIDVINQEA
jgi:uncharacterized protein (TIGR00730 family)